MRLAPALSLNFQLKKQPSDTIKVRGIVLAGHRVSSARLRVPFSEGRETCRVCCVPNSQDGTFYAQIRVCPIVIKHTYTTMGIWLYRLFCFDHYSANLIVLLLPACAQIACLDRLLFHYTLNRIRGTFFADSLALLIS